MPRRTIQIAMNGVTGRMGRNQHLIRSILALQKEGGLQLKDGTWLYPEPVLIGRDQKRVQELAGELKIARWTTDLATALAAVPEADRYRSANGDSWSGEGSMPQWLKQAISAGQSIGHFELPSGSVSKPPLQAGADWTNDPFAGSPLARSSPARS